MALSKLAGFRSGRKGPFEPLNRFLPPTRKFENSSRNFPASATTKVLSALSLVAFRISWRIEPACTSNSARLNFWSSLFCVLVSKLFTDCRIFSAVTLSTLISALVRKPSVRRLTPASSASARCLKLDSTVEIWPSISSRAGLQSVATLPFSIFTSQTLLVASLW